MVKEVTQTTTPPTENTIDTLFTSAKKVLQRTGVKAFVWGPPGVGKTHFALSFPPPIYAISTEFGVAQLLGQFPDKDIRIMECTEPYSEPAVIKRTGEADTQPFSVDPILSLKAVEKATEALKDVKEGTIILDSISDIWAWLGAWIEINADKQYKSGGMMRTEWGKANARYRTIIMRLISRPTNFVMTSRSQAVYDGTGNVTQQTKFKAQQETPYFADLIVKLDKKAQANVDITTGKQTGFTMKRSGTIEKCRYGDVVNTGLSDTTYDGLKKALKGVVSKEVFG